MRFAKRCAALMALAAVVAMPAALAAERAAVTVYAGGVDFQPQVSYASARLTVSGNGITFSRTVERGRGLSIDPLGPDGRLLPDGVYSWQLELTPDARTAAGLREAASRGEAIDDWSAQSGSFAIRGGFFADAALVEEQALRRAEADVRPGTRGSAFAADRAAGEDSDTAVGSRVGVEAEARAAAARQAPVAGTSGALVRADRAATDDSDAMTSAAGRSLERAAGDDEINAQTRGFTPRPRSDGSNGRPRS